MYIFPKSTYSGLVTIVECQIFGFVTVTGHLCRSVELIQRVTVTGVCQIDRNGTVVLKGAEGGRIEELTT